MDYIGTDAPSIENRHIGDPGYSIQFIICSKSNVSILVSNILLASPYPFTNTQ